MINKTNLVGGTALLMGGLGEMVATQAICPVCIASITGGSAIIANSLGLNIIKG